MENSVCMVNGIFYQNSMTFVESSVDFVENVLIDNYFSRSSLDTTKQLVDVKSE